MIIMKGKKCLVLKYQLIAYPLNRTGYFHTMRRDLTNAFRKKLLDCNNEEMLFHQDNNPSYRASETLMTIDFHLYEQRRQHPAYRQDLAPMNFAVFLQLKGRMFQSLEEHRMVVRSKIKRFRHH